MMNAVTLLSIGISREVENLRLLVSCCGEVE